VSQQSTLVRGLLRRHQRVVYNVGQFAVHGLSGNADLAGVLWIERPLWPELGVSDTDGKQQDTAASK
jgi:hypothetical protein